MAGVRREGLDPSKASETASWFGLGEVAGLLAIQAILACLLPIQTHRQARARPGWGDFRWVKSAAMLHASEPSKQTCAITRGRSDLAPERDAG